MGLGRHPGRDLPSRGHRAWRQEPGPDLVMEVDDGLCGTDPRSQGLCHTGVPSTPASVHRPPRPRAGVVPAMSAGPLPAGFPDRQHQTDHSAPWSPPAGQAWRTPWVPAASPRAPSGSRLVPLETQVFPCKSGVSFLKVSWGWSQPSTLQRGFPWERPCLPYVQRAGTGCPEPAWGRGTSPPAGLPAQPAGGPGSWWVQAAPCWCPLLAGAALRWAPLAAAGVPGTCVVSVAASGTGCVAGVPVSWGS